MKSRRGYKGDCGNLSVMTREHRLHAVYACRFGRPLFKSCVLACAVAGPAVFFFRLPSAVFFGLLALLAITITVGSFYPPSGIFGRPLLRGPCTRPLIALTFDDGPDEKYTPKVLEVLGRHGARATFFVIGERAARHPELVAELIRQGHQVENHSLRHAFTTPFLPRAKLAAELRETQEIIARAAVQAGQGPKHPRFFRPPVGILSPPVVAAARRVGLRLCGWSCKSRDGLLSTTAEQAFFRLRHGLRPGAILLLHDAANARGEKKPGPAAKPPVAMAVLERLLPLCQERGLRPVTLDELLSEEFEQKFA